MTMRDYPFDEAVEVFGDPQIVARLRSLDPADDRIFENGAYTQGAISRKLREKLHEALISALCEGSLIASYRDRSRPGRYRRSDLEPAWWRIAEVDFDEFGNAHEVEGPAFEDIRVRRADADTREAAPQGEQELDEGTRLQWSKGRRILTLDGKELYFQGDVQLAIVDELYRAFVAGRRCGLNDILTTANSRADTLAKAFSGNRNWPVLKTIIRVRHRECWFDLSGN